jgi:hypothetical protein
MMTLYDKLVAIYPELAEDENILRREIVLRDDSDGQGAYIEKWDYSKPIPEGLTVGKPSA